MNASKDTASPSVSVVVKEISDITPNDVALYEAGKSLLLESIETGREFCKFMIGASVGAIPVYIAVLKFVLPEKYEFKSFDVYLYIAPGLMFLVAAIVFVLGYLPRTSQLSLTWLDGIDQQRKIVISHRQRHAVIGLIIYCLGLASAGWITISAISFSGARKNGDTHQTVIDNQQPVGSPRQSLQPTTENGR